MFILQSKKPKSQGPNELFEAEEEESISQRVCNLDATKRTSSFLKDKVFVYERPRMKKGRKSQSNFSEGTEDSKKTKSNLREGTNGQKRISIL